MYSVHVYIHVLRTLSIHVNKYTLILDFHQNNQKRSHLEVTFYYIWNDFFFGNRDFFFGNSFPKKKSFQCNFYIRKIISIEETPVGIPSWRSRFDDGVIRFGIGAFV